MISSSAAMPAARMGYNLLTQMDDGSLFAADYFMQEDGNPRGGAGFMAGAKFKI